MAAGNMHQGSLGPPRLPRYGGPPGPPGPPEGGGPPGDRYRVPEFPHSSATFSILSGFHILASPKVLQGAFGDCACPMQCSQPCPMLANRHPTGLTWFPMVLYYIK